MSSLAGNKDRLYEFTKNLLEQNHAVVEPAGSLLLQSLLPESLIRFLEISGEEHLFSFEQRQEDAYENALFVLVGSQIFDKLLKLGSASGHKVVTKVHGLELQNRSYLASLYEKIVFQNARIKKLVDEQPATYEYSLFTFKITITCDDSHEYIKSILISNRTMALLQEHIESFARLQLEAFAPKSPLFQKFSEKQLLEHAYSQLQWIMQPEIAALKKKYLTKLERDIERLNVYYGTLYAETASPRRRTQIDEEAIKSKLEVIQQELKHKTSELLQRYSLKVSIVPDSILLILMPVVVGNILVERKKLTRLVDIVYNPLVRGIEPFVCEACQRNVVSPLCCNDQAHLICANCFTTCPKCEQKICLACHPEGCAKCNRK